VLIGRPVATEYSWHPMMVDIKPASRSNRCWCLPGASLVSPNLDFVLT